MALPLPLVRWALGCVPLPDHAATWTPCPSADKDSILKLDVGVQAGLHDRTGHGLCPAAAQGPGTGALAGEGLSLRPALGWVQRRLCDEVGPLAGIPPE